MATDPDPVLFCRENDSRVTELSTMRRELRLAAQGWGLDERQLQTLVFVVSELATNAIQHARTPSVVIVGRPRADMLHVAVTDHSVTPPASDAALRWSGLQIVTALVRDWGWDVHGTGKTVWADVHLAESGDVP